MYLTSWEEKGYIKEKELKICWKGYDFDVLNNLTEKGYLYPARYKNKSVTITQAGEVLANKLIEKYLK